MVQGRQTTEIAEKLKSKLREGGARYRGVEVHYDHGDRTKEGVCQPTSYIGRRYGADATLSGIDIVAVKDGKVFLVVEVEEGKYVRPKVILGDVFGVALAAQVRIQGDSYPLDRATVVVGVTLSDRGRRGEKFVRLERLLAKNVAALHRGSGRPTVETVRIIAAEPGDLVRRIERLMRREAGQR